MSIHYNWFANRIVWQGVIDWQYEATGFRRKSGTLAPLRVTVPVFFMDIAGKLGNTCTPLSLIFCGATMYEVFQNHGLRGLVWYDTFRRDHMDKLIKRINELAALKKLRPSALLSR